MCNHLLKYLLIFLLGPLFQITIGVYIDCEQPPTVDYATWKIADLDTNDLVAATYTCTHGYILQGETELFCNLDTDEWQGDPPLCQKVEKPPAQLSILESEQHNQQQRRRKSKLLSVPEDETIDSEFGRQLDLSCVGRDRGESIRPPTIENAYIEKYSRRRKDGNIFLVAFYQCDEDYELDPPDNDRLYCSQERWVGDHPKCINIPNEDGDDDDDGNDDDVYDEEGDGEEGNYKDEDDEDNDGDDGDGVDGDVDKKEDDEYNNENDKNRQDENENDTFDNDEDNKNDEDKEEENEENNNLIENDNHLKEDDEENDINIKNDIEINSSSKLSINKTKTEKNYVEKCKTEEDKNSIDCLTCTRGFKLDENDGKSCIDIDECSINNGGCEQICKNLPGSFECSCHAGLQLDVSNGKSCIDINECLLQNGHGLCQDTCINTYGSYRCTCDGLPGTKLTKMGRCEDAGDCKRNNGGCSQRCMTTKFGRLFCLCDPGYALIGDDLKKCKDINECEDPKISSECEYGCENTIGSYYCRSPPPPLIEISTTNDNLEQDRSENEVIITENNDNDSTKFDQNVSEKIEDEHPDDDEDEEEDLDENDEDEDEKIDKFTNENEEDNNIIENNKVKENKINCQNGYERNEINECVIVVVNSVDKNIPPIDRCATENTGCDHCRNVDNGFECTCPDGFELSDDERTCLDINECEEYSNDDDDEDEDESSIGGICSHTCQNTHGSFICQCPDNFHLQDDGRTCARDYCSDLENLGKQKCSHQCQDQSDGFKCTCPTEETHNYILDTDQRTCIQKQIENSVNICDKYESHCFPGICIPTADDPESFTCNCPSGYVDKARRCHDIDECQQGQHNCTHDCENVKGSYKCQCPNGFQLLDDLSTCEDIDECATTAEICENDQYCINTYGSYKCTCATGFTLDLHTNACKQLNACQQNNGNCSHLCEIIAGDEEEKVVCGCPLGMTLNQENFKICEIINPCEVNNGGCLHFCNSIDLSCYCQENYILHEDGHNCVDINECENNRGGCSHNCENTEGGFLCNCNDGYQLASNSLTECEDINECLINSSLCDQICTNEIGKYRCDCYQGHELDQFDEHKCVDKNECNENNGNCSHVCENTIGSHRCACPTGQQLIHDNKTCEVINQCDINNGGCSHLCEFKQNQVQCLCPNGYQLDDVIDVDNHHHDRSTNCVDINECDQNNGDCEYDCKNHVGHFECLCPSGFELDTKNKRKCHDIDECIENNGNCTNICLNLIGSHKCECETGFRLNENDRQSCVDIDECIEIGHHGCSHECQNTHGTYECTCPQGFKLIDHFNCIDIDECSNSIAKCSHYCENTVGSFNCTCPSGYKLLTDQQTCQDIDECTENIAKCSHSCYNTNGSYDCLCPDGFKLNEINNFTCIEIDNCLKQTQCSHKCVNTIGGFRCECPAGYTLDQDFQTCIDINECQIANGGCSHVCNNINGNYTCGCPTGFTLQENGKYCESNDLCLEKNGGCEHICTTVDNGIQCSCQNGFSINPSDNSTCVDIDECQSTEHECQHQCINVIGSFKCQCHVGYRMSPDNKNKCIDIDECTHRNGGCAKQAKCANLIGGFRCICPPGQTLAYDKKHCMEIKDLCKPISPPKYGDVRCSRARHRTQLFYKTKCKFSCHQGYKLQGAATKQCNGTGHWDVETPVCVPESCDKIIKPKHGIISPIECLTGEISVGERCVLHCDKEFKPAYRRTAVCDTNRKWTPDSNLTCIPILISSSPSVVHRVHSYQHSSTPKKATKLAPLLLSSTTSSPSTSTSASTSPSTSVISNQIIRPVIKCPPDATKLLGPYQKTILIKMERPKTNVDWWKYVDSHPAWGKKLETHLLPGVHIVTFRARSPNSKIVDICRTVITIKESNPPIVEYCPNSTIIIHLKSHQQTQEVYWKEPIFKSPSGGHIKDIFKSKMPGEKFGPGEYLIKYVAYDQDNLNSKCEFKIIVKNSISKTLMQQQQHHPIQQQISEQRFAGGIEQTVIPKPSTNNGGHHQYRHQQQENLKHHHQQQLLPHLQQHHQLHQNQQQQQHSGHQQKIQRLQNHESYVICPGKPAIKLDTNFPYPIPRGCLIKNVRLPRYSHIHRRHNTNSMLKHYSSWDDPNKPASFIHQYHRNFA